MGYMPYAAKGEIKEFGTRLLVSSFLKLITTVSISAAGILTAHLMKLYYLQL